MSLKTSVRKLGPCARFKTAVKRACFKISTKSVKVTLHLAIQKGDVKVTKIYHTKADGVIELAVEKL